MKKLLLLMVVIFLSNQSLAQEIRKEKKTGPRRQIATIVFAGLGGAILGLSTLSFYGRPQEQLSNIAVGFAVGVIAGTAYVTFSTATTKDYYDDQKDLGPEGGRPQGLNEPRFQLSPTILSATDKSLLPGAHALFRF